MERIKSIFNIYKKRIVFISSIILILIGVFCFGLINSKYNAKEKIVEVQSLEKQKEVVVDEKAGEIVSRIKVDVKGAVKNPGVYELDENSRVIDAINASGGLNKNAYTRYLNLAKKIYDEYVILVNTESEIKEIKDEIKKNVKKLTNKEECVCETITNTCIEENNVITSEIIQESENKIENVNSENTLNTFVNINTSSLEELTTLNGIGSSTAQKIIDFRNTNGLFKSIEEIKNVSGIGEKLYEKIKDNIIV